MTEAIENPAVADARPQSGQAYRIYAMVLSVGVLCSLAIVSTYELTRPIIARNKIAQRRRAILDVIPKADSIGTFAYDQQAGTFRSVPEETDDENLVFAGFDASGELVGLAMAGQGMGYQDAIHLLYGYDPAAQTVMGLRVLESRETPGLGDRIEKDPGYLQNFQALDVRLGDDGQTVAHEIAFVKQGEKQDPWQIDGITGATISSRAVAEILRASTSTWVPRMHKSLSEFRPPSAEGASP